MAQFGNLTITTKGLQLQAKAQLGTQLAFTRVAFGDGQLPEGQKLIDLTNMISEKITSPITSIDVIGDGTTRIRAALSNNNLNQGFYLREVGVFATDPVEGEILYAIANAGTYPDFLPAGTGSTIVETTMDLITIVGNATNVTAKINESLTYTTVADFNEKVGNVAELSNGQIVKELKSHATSLADMETQISDLETNKADKAEVNSLATEKANQSDLETTNINVISKADITYVDTKVSAIDRGIGGTKANLAEIQSTFPTGDAKRYVTADTGHWYFWNGSAWTDGGIFQGVGIADGSITASMANDSLYAKVQDINAYERLNLEDAFSNLFYGSDGSLSLTQIDTHTGDTYFNDLTYGGGAYATVTGGKFKITANNPNGYIFYKVNCIDDLAVGNKMSLAVKVDRDNVAFSKAYAFRDVSNAIIGSIVPLANMGDGWYLKQNIDIPVGAVKLEFRFDMTNATPDEYVLFSSPIIVANKLILFDYNTRKISKLETGVNSLDSRVLSLENSPNFKSRIFTSVPNGFNWVPPISIATDGRGNFATKTDVSSFQHMGSGKTYYVNITNGSDTNDGLTPSTALQKIKTAVAKSDVDIIMVATGVYDRSNAFDGVKVQKNLSIKAMEDANVKITTHSPLTWTLTSGKTNTYQASRSYAYATYDSSIVDANGDYTKLTKVNSIDEVEATAGTWYTESNIVYVHTHDTRVPDSNIRVYLGSVIYNVNVDGAYTFYAEGIDFEGGATGCVRGGENSKIYAKNCSFKYASGNGGTHITGAEIAIFQNCISAKNEADGFNYHLGTTIIPKFIEIDCVGRDNGYDGNDNGSTSHDGVIGVRINGLYCNNFGPDVADVSTGTQTWNLGCVAFGSKANYNFQISNGDAWYDSCIGYSAPTASLNISDNADAYVRNSKFESELISSGTKNSY